MIATKVEFAFGANLAANPATWTWTDVSQYARGQVSVRPGRVDEASTTQPATCSLRLANNDSRFSPRHPNGAYYPNVRRNTPVRVSLNPGSGYTQRFQGYVDTFTPIWLFGNSTQAEVNVTAAGSLRRLRQGAVLRSSLLRAYSTSSVVPLVYLPMEDGANSTQFTAGIAGLPNAAITLGMISLAQVSTCPGSAPLPSMTIPTTASTFTVATVSIPAGPDSFFAIDFTAQVPASALPATASCPVFIGLTSGGTWTDVDITFNNNFGSLQFFGTRPNLTQDMFAQYDPGSLFDGQWHHYRVTATQSGGNVVFTLECDGVQVVTNTIAGTLAHLTVGQFLGQVGMSYSYGHVAIFGQSTSSFYQPSIGFAGELATDRLTRLCGENQVSLTLSTTASHIQMGPQRVDTLLNLLRECEAADGGILFDGLSAGLSYLSNPDRTNQAVAVALDCNLHQVKLPFAPVEDDQRVRNDWTVNRPNGSFARFKNATHVAANGLYDDSATRNVYTDSMLPDQASWLVNLGTVEEMRVPGVSIDPLHNSELQSSWLATTIGERITATHLPTQYPPGTLDLIVEGYAETWNQVMWNVELNCSPYRPWEVFSIQDARLGRIETDGSTLNSSATTTATSLSVASSGGLWDTGSTPFDIEIEGEQITVTAISGSSSPQTFTVTRSVNGVVKAHNSAVVVKLWKPGVLAL